jgi:hypothetical protein
MHRVPPDQISTRGANALSRHRARRSVEGRPNLGDRHPAPSHFHAVKGDDRNRLTISRGEGRIARDVDDLKVERELAPQARGDLLGFLAETTTRLALDDERHGETGRA